MTNSTAEETNADGTPKGETPPWGDDFDAEKAWALVKGLRSDKAALQTKLTTAETELGTLKSAAQAAEDEKKTDEQKIADRVTKAEQAAKEANRLLYIERAKRKHSVPDELDEFLTGDTEDEINSKAERLAGLHKPDAETPEVDEITGKPKPALVPGQGGEQTPAFDADAIVAAVRNRP